VRAAALPTSWEFGCERYRLLLESTAGTSPVVAHRPASAIAQNQIPMGVANNTRFPESRGRSKLLTLALLLYKQRRRDEAHVLRAEIYSWSTESFETALKDGQNPTDS
jgi:hypothetical protein